MPAPPEKPDFIESKLSTEIKYTPEELESIKELTSFFNNAPGQINLSELSEEGQLSSQGNEEKDSNDLSLNNKETENLSDNLGGLDELNAPAESVDDLGGLGGLDDLNAPAESVDDLGGLGGLNDLNAPAESMDDLGGLDDLNAPAESVDDLGGLGSLDDLNAPAGSMDDLGGLDDLNVPAGSVDDFGGLDDLNTPAESVDDLVDMTQIEDFEKIQSDPVETAQSQDNIVSTEFISNESDLTLPSLEDISPTTIAFSTDTSEQKNESHSSSAIPLLNNRIQFSDDIIKSLREKLKFYPFQIKKLVINTIIEDKLSEIDVQELVNIVVKKVSVEEVQSFLEEKLGVDLGEFIDNRPSTTKVIISDIDYSAENLEKTTRNIKRIKYGGLAVILLLSLSAVSYWLAIKPWLYKRLVTNAKEIILSRKPNPPLFTSINTAENLFEKARQYYPKKIYAYLQIAHAYQRVGLYTNTFEKLFGKISLNQTIRLYDENVSESKKFWNKIRNVPVVSYTNKNLGQIKLDQSIWTIQKKGAYLISHLDKKDDDAQVLLALGKFHSNPTIKFKNSFYRNNLLGIAYFRRILTFDVKVPFLKGDDYRAMALGGIGDVYYQQKKYYKSNEYYEKIVINQPDNIIGHAGILKNLLKLYSKQVDPRLIIDYHNKIKYSVKIEDKLPLYTLSSLAAFYIDLPDQDELRIKYNISPNDFVTQKTLKSRSIELLNILYRSQRKDEYGSISDGRYFSEGYYQRGRYFRNILNQPRVAMKQFEYAYEYKPEHFLALNERAEILIDINDYQSASDNLKLAIEQLTPEKLALLGQSPDDETLLDADIANIYFNYGKSIYLSSIQNLRNMDSWQRIQEIKKYNVNSEFGMEALVRELDKAEVYFRKADSIGIIDEKRRTELNYFQGWSAYAKGNSQKALFYWDSIAPYYQLQHQNLELAKSHALYKLATTIAGGKSQYLQASLGYLTFLQGYYEKRSSNILKPSDNNKAHIKLFTRLAIIENNIGAIHELLNNEEKSIEHYWKSINYSQRISRENEIARYNLKLSFKRAGLASPELIPVIMDYISPKLFETIKN